MERKSWIELELDWSIPISGEFAYLASVGPDDGLVGVIADDGVTVPVQGKKEAEVLHALAPNLGNACRKLVSVPKARSGTDQTRTFHLCDLLKVAEGKVVFVLGPEPSMSYGQRHPEHRRVAKERMQQYEAECELKKRAGEELRAKLPDGFKRMVDAIGSPHPVPRRLQLSDLGLQLEEVGFVPVLPKFQRERLRAVMNAVAFSGRGESRTGRYSCTPIATAVGDQAAIVRWTPRTSIPPALELKAALERRFRSALLNPRSFDQIPPEPFVVEAGITSGAIPDIEAETDANDLPGRLEEAIGAMGGAREAREDLRRKFGERGFDAVAWYQPFHRFAGPVSGLYLDAPKLDCLAFSLAQDLMASEPRPYHLAVQLALRLTTAHEMFHAKVEFAATWLEVSSRRRRYLPYVRDVYEATRCTSDWLEEALANWSTRDWLEHHLKHLQSIGHLQCPESVTRVIEDWLDFSPAGYNNWRVGYDGSSWRRLAAELAASRPHREEDANASLPLEGLLRAASLFDLRQDDVPIFFLGSGVVADICFSAPSRREVLRVLDRSGYRRVPARGKGSHEAWRGPDSRVFTVPARDPLSVGVFHQLLAHFGWTKQQYLREIRREMIRYEPRQVLK